MVSVTACAAIVVDKPNDRFSYLCVIKCGATPNLLPGNVDETVKQLQRGAEGIFVIRELQIYFLVKRESFFYL